MREHPLPTPNDTDGDKRRPLLLLTLTVPFTKDDLDTAAVSCDTDALLATAITTDRRSNTVLVFFLLLLLLVAKLEQKKPRSSRNAKQSNWSFALRRPTNNTLLLSKDAGGDGWRYRKARHQLVVRQIYILWTNQWLSRWPSGGRREFGPAGWIKQRPFPLASLKITPKLTPLRHLVDILVSSVPLVPHCFHALQWAGHSA